MAALPERSVILLDIRTLPRIHAHVFSHSQINIIIYMVPDMCKYTRLSQPNHKMSVTLTKSKQEFAIAVESR